MNQYRDGAADHDSAIKTKSEDRYEFTDYAKYIKEIIINTTKQVDYDGNPIKDSAVFGIEGEWGSGKTSLLNLVKEQLSDKKPEPIIVNFDPWMVKSIDQITNYFFSNFQKVVMNHYRLIAREKSETTTWKSSKEFFQTKRKLKAIKRAFKNYRFIFDSISLGKNLSLKLSKVVDDFCDCAEHLKKKINDVLKSDVEPIIVFVDNLDRLNKEELNVVLRLLKTACDFKNTYFVVAYDKKHICKMLHGQNENYGKDFLDKIIQVEIPIKEIKSSEEVDKLYDKFISITPESIEDKSKVFNNYLRGISFECIRIKTPRELKRMLNKLIIDYYAVKSGVNKHDFFLITMMKHVDSDWFDFLKNNIEKLLSDSNRSKVRFRNNFFEFLNNEYKSFITNPVETEQEFIESLLSIPKIKFLIYATVVLFNKFNSIVRVEEMLFSEKLDNSYEFYRPDNLMNFPFYFGTLYDKNTLVSLRSRANLIKLLEKDTGFCIGFSDTTILKIFEMNSIRDVVNDCTLPIDSMVYFLRYLNSKIRDNNHLNFKSIFRSLNRLLHVLFLKNLFSDERKDKLFSVACNIFKMLLVKFTTYQTIDKSAGDIDKSRYDLINSIVFSRSENSIVLKLTKSIRTKNRVTINGVEHPIFFEEKLIAMLALEALDTQPKMKVVFTNPRPCNRGFWGNIIKDNYNESPTHSS